MSLIVDSDCSNNLCASGNSKPEKTNFSEKTDDIILHIFVIFILFIFCKLLIVEYILPTCFANSSELCYRKFNKFTYFIRYKCLIELIISSIILIYYYNTTEINICEYNDYCNFENNTLVDVYKLYYKLINDECPDFSELHFKYTDYYLDKPNYIGNSCSNSDYGCCKMNIQCELTVTRNYTEKYYNNLVEHNRGFATNNMYKVDEEGSNCPDAVSMILGVTKIHNNKLYDKLKLLFCIDLLILIFILINVINIKKEENKKEENNEEEKIQLTEKHVLYKFSENV